MQQLYKKYYGGYMEIFLIVILITMSALFSSSETAFSSVNKIRLKNYAAQGDQKAKKALKIANSFDDALTAILIGNNIVNIASASIGTVFFTRLFPNGGVGISTAVMTVVVLIFGEIMPKSYAKENAEKCALFFAQPLSLLIILLKPLIWLFTMLKKLISKFNKKSVDRPSVTEDELKYIIEEIEEQGVLEEQESNLVRSALEFDETEVSEILIPRVNIVGVEAGASLTEIENVFLSEFYSRLPVYEKSLDNIIGIITHKDFFKLLRTGNASSIKEIIQDVIYISDLKLISEALREMQRSKTHLAVVMDQYGGTKGIITMEDIIEELVGEIYDENDEVVPSVVKLSANEYEVSAELSINDLLRQLDMDEDTIESTANSVGGWITELLGHLPEVGETIESGIFRIKILSTDEQKLEKIKLSISEKDDESDL